MDFKDPKTQKIILGVIALFIVGYFWYTRLYVKYDAQIAQRSAEFETITTNLRNVEMKAKSLDELFREPVCLRKQIAGVDAHDRGARHDPVNQMQHDGRGGAKAGRRDQPVPVPIRGPSDQLLWARLSEDPIFFIEVGIDRRDADGFHDALE